MEETVLSGRVSRSRAWRTCESGKNRGRLRSGRQLLWLRGGVGEAGMPAVEVVGQVAVEHPGADLEQQVGVSGRSR